MRTHKIFNLTRCKERKATRNPDFIGKLRTSEPCLWGRSAEREAPNSERLPYINV